MRTMWWLALALAVPAYVLLIYTAMVAVSLVPPPWFSLPPGPGCTAVTRVLLWAEGCTFVLLLTIRLLWDVGPLRKP